MKKTSRGTPLTVWVAPRDAKSIDRIARTVHYTSRHRLLRKLVADEIRKQKEDK